MLRVEDLDEGRVREELVESQLADLRAIGIDWDGDVVRQSNRVGLYAAALDRLAGAGLVYPCFCSRREVREAASAQHGASPDGLYPGTCRDLPAAEVSRRLDAGDRHALRLRAGGAEATIGDRLHGELTAPVDDLVLRRSDGAFAYNLAVVVDDGEQGVEEVVRGDDLLPSTPAQAHLCDLLGIERPSWAHVPLVVGADGERLAKRHGAVTLRDLEAAGTGPAEALAWMATSLGLSGPGAPVAGPADLLERFDPENLPSASTVFSGI